MTTDLEGAVRAIVDDLSASGFSVTFQCTATAPCSRLQATTLSRVCREMGANVLRHGDPRRPVTASLIQSESKVHLVMTNGVSTTHDLPSSGAGILGMRERVTAIGGTLETLEENMTWMVSATVPSAPTTSPAPLEELP